MNLAILLALLQDGITTGAIYALLGLALVLVFAVTRVIFIPQGEFATFGALTLAFLVHGRVPGTVHLLMALGIVVCLVEAGACWRLRRWRGFARTLAWALALPLVLEFAAPWIAGKDVSLALRAVFALVLVVAMGPMVYRLVYQPVAQASVLVLLIISVALHFALVGLGLLFFGAEGWRTPALVDGVVRIGSMTWRAQTIVVLLVCIALIVGLWLFFRHTLYGSALRATAVNRRGARLVGISTHSAGMLAFTLAAGIGAVSGILIGAITTMHYDTGFLIGLKGFVAAIIGGMVSYPATAIGALFVGILESFASFWASAYKEAIVFAVIIPALMWLSFRSAHMEEDD